MFYIKENDTSPVLEVTLQDSDGDAVDVTGATVRFHMRAIGSTTAKVNAAATIVTAASGVVRYTWQTGDTDTIGEFEGEFQVTFGGGAVQSFPNDGWLRISILDDIA